MAVWSQPCVDLDESFGSNAVETPLGVGSHRNDSGLAHHTQVLGHRRLAQPEMFDQVAHGAFPFAQQIEDLPAIRLGENCKAHGMNIANRAYNCQAILGEGQKYVPVYRVRGVSNVPSGAITEYPGRAGYESNGAMVSFDARLRVPGQARLPINVGIEVANEMIKFTSGDNDLGEWPQEKVEVEIQSDGFHLTFDGEEIVLTVTDPAGFALALGVSASRPRKQASPSVSVPPGPEVVLSEQNGAPRSNGISNRLESISPEEKFADVIERISRLRTMLTDAAIPPQDVFGQWLRLLKEINLRHGQGAMPTPLFYRLNTELLELIPAPPRPAPERQPAAAGVGS